LSSRQGNSENTPPTRAVVWLPFLSTGTGSDTYTLRLHDALHALGYTVHLQGFSKRWEALPRLLSWVRPPRGADIVIANSWNAAAFQRAGIPLISVFHHTVSADGMWQHLTAAQKLYHRLRIMPLEVRAIRCSRHCIAPSRFTADSVAAHFNTRPPRVIPHGIDTDTFRPAIRRDGRARSVDDPVRLLFVGKPSRRKGVDLIRTTMERLGRGFTLDMIGGIPELAMPENVRAHRPMPSDSLISYLQQVDVLLFPSRLEGFGYAVAEAMACALPVVALRRSAIAELIDDGVNGLLCNREDPDCLADAVRTLCNNPGLRERIASSARKTIESRFSNDRFAQRYDALIQETLQNAD
jgi:glycosyltransferase involved in cell wall biosynthesis